MPGLSEQDSTMRKKIFVKDSIVFYVKISVQDSDLQDDFTPFPACIAPVFEVVLFDLLFRKFEISHTHLTANVVFLQQMDLVLKFSAKGLIHSQIR